MEIKRGVLLVLVACFLLVATLSFSIAEEKDDNESNTLKTEKNMTYGQCVSAGAKVKNDCYSSVKATYAVCKNNVTDATVCKADYKKDMKQCKADFKSVKNDCKKIKHNFLETARYAFA